MSAEYTPPPYSPSSTPTVTAIPNLTSDGFVYTSGGNGTLNSSWTVAPTSTARTTTGSGTNVSLTAGAVTASAFAGTITGGSFTLKGGNATGSTGILALGGALIISGGNAVSGTSANVGGDVTISGGTGDAVQNGNVNITGHGKSGSNVGAGFVGEVVSSILAPASAVSLVTATGKTVTSITLTAGTWLLEGVVTLTYGTATATASSSGVGGTANTVTVDGTESNRMVSLGLASAIDSMTVTRKPVVATSTTTYYLTAKATFSAGTVTAYGTLTAVRT